MRPIHFKVIKDNQGNKSVFKRHFLRFHSLHGSSTGKSNPCLVNCKCWVIGIFKTGSKEKITWPNLLFPVNEELRLPFTILEGSSEVSPLHSSCLTAVSIYLSQDAEVHDSASFITVTSTYLPHCHTANEIQAMFSPSCPLKGRRIPLPTAANWPNHGCANKWPQSCGKGGSQNLGQPGKAKAAFPRGRLPAGLLLASEVRHINSWW